MSINFQQISTSNYPNLNQEKMSSKFLSSAQKRKRGDDYFSQQGGLSNFNAFNTNKDRDQKFAGDSFIGNQQSQQAQLGYFNKFGDNKSTNQMNNNNISMMSNHGFVIQNNLKGYNRHSQETSANTFLNQSSNQLYKFNAKNTEINQFNFNNQFNQISNETLPIHQDIPPNPQILNPGSYNISYNNDTELLRREVIKEQNLQEKMLVVQKEQKIQSEIAYSFKQMSRLLDACLKQDETGAGITSVKQNDFQLPHGSNFIQFKAIEFPQRIVEYYTDLLENQYESDQQRNDEESISVNKGIIAELSLAWVSINKKLFMWKYGPQSFAQFTRLYNKNEYYRQNKDQYGTKRDDKIDKDDLKEFDLEDTILYIAFGQPKYAIFKQNEIKNVLVIAFPNYIKVMHIKLEHNNIDIQDINVSISTDHEYVNKIVFSKKGRIFFGGSSGRVKYIDYFKSQILGITISEKFKAKEGVNWQQKFKQQIPLLNQDQQVIDISVDDTRQILYALVEVQCDKPFFRNPFSYNPYQQKTTQRIDVYDLGAFDEDFTLIGSLTHAQFADQLLSSQTNHFHLLPTSKELSIISVSAIEKYQSNDYNFVIVTQSGIRVYYVLKTKPVTDKKNQILSAQETKEAREKFQMFEKYRPIAEFQIAIVKGMLDISHQNSAFRNLHVFYDHKDYQTCKGSYVQVIDDEQKKYIKSAFATRGGVVMQKIENKQNRLIFIESNQQYIARLKENMFSNHQIFSEIHPNFVVATERMGELILDFQNRDENSNILNDLTFAQIPEKNLLPPQISSLILLNSFEQLETSQMIGEQNGQQAYVCLNDLTKQCYSQPSHYVVLTSKGILLYYQQRPIDLLYQLIKVLPDYITEPNQTQAQLQFQLLNQKKLNKFSNKQIDIKNNQQQKQNSLEFFEQFIITYGVTETFAMLSQMLCHSHLEYYQNLNVHNHLDKQLKNKLSDTTLNNTNNFTQGTQYEQNTNKFPGQKNNEKPLDPSQIPETIITEISESILKKSHFLFQKYGDILLDETSENQYQSKQMNDEFQNTLGKAWEWTRRKYTSKVEGVLLYFSRLIRPVWNKPLVNSYAFKFFINEPIENFKREEIQAFTRRLNEFKFWLENETKVIYCNELKNNTLLGSDSNQSINNIYMKSASISTSNRYGNQNRYKSNEERMQEIKADEAKLIDDLLRFCSKIIQVANLFLFISENKLRSNLNNVEFRDLREEILQIRFKDVFTDKKNEKIVKNYVLQAIKLDPKYMDQAKMVLSQFNTIFHDRDFNISQAEIKLQMILSKFARTGVPEAKYLNECTNILLEHIEYLNSDYIDKFFMIYSSLDSRVDFTKIAIECIKFHQRIIENIERQQQETQALEEQLRASQQYNPVNKYSEQLKIQKQILDDNSQQREFCLQKIIQILEDLHKESEFDPKTKVNKDLQILNIVKLIQNYPSDFVHSVVIDFLLRNKRKSEILELNSPFTEQIFSNFGTDNAECLKIKFKYLEQMGNVREAYNVAFQLSNFKNREESEDRVLLDDRISFTEIAIYDISVILSDFNISETDKIRYYAEREILVKQARILKIQKKMYEKLLNGINYVENSLKKSKTSGDKKTLEQKKLLLKESYDVLQFMRLDEHMLEKYYVWPLNLVEFALILYDMTGEQKVDSSINSIYDKLIGRMLGNDIYETKQWPHNIQDTLIMLNEEIEEKARLFNLDHIVVKCESNNAQISQDIKFQLKDFIYLYNQLLVQKEDSDIKILSSPLWMPHFLVTKLNFSPLNLISHYSAIGNILKGEVSNSYNIHIKNCLFILLRHSINYISNVLQNHEQHSREFISIRNSIQILEKVLESFNNEFMALLQSQTQNKSEIIQYQQQLSKLQEEISLQIGEIEQLDSDFQYLNQGANYNNSIESQQSLLNGSKNKEGNSQIFEFDQDSKPLKEMHNAEYIRKMKEKRNDALQDPANKLQMAYILGGFTSSLQNRNESNGSSLNQTNKSKQNTNSSNQHQTISFGDSKFFESNSNSRQNNTNSSGINEYAFYEFNKILENKNEQEIQLEKNKNY
ncbi:Hypothetical protein TTHERM_00760460 (macronuclear) [Tetrahymena thermophila SB210]|uniref:Nucleoporin Nup133/Nup155-like N-terminal domain-containing protein n=2 Tax=Tetrahymena thermophila TaxID=5911 RepID=I7MCI3_TETTS|eukprot:XP_001031662.2 Hypothetical protein TTHERM_00760460 [Tetrahymena thermophila SB210]